jgi:hypothetical protein
LAKVCQPRHAHDDVDVVANFEEEHVGSGGLYVNAEWDTEGCRSA